MTSDRRLTRSLAGGCAPSDALIRARDQLLQTLDELEISGNVRSEMVLEPDEALAVIGNAQRARGIRNPAAFINERWRTYKRAARARAQRTPPASADFQAGVDLAALEYAWSRPPSVVTAAILDAMSAAIAKQGGCSTLLERPLAKP